MTSSPDQKSQQSASTGVVYASISLPDPNRSPAGAWLIPHNLQNRIEALRSRDLTEAECWERAGATWDEDYYTRIAPSDDCILFVFDPAKTKTELTVDSTTFSGAWKMTRDKKREAFRLKESNPQWAWSKCFEEAGAKWDIWHYLWIGLEDYTGEEWPPSVPEIQ